MMHSQTSELAESLVSEQDSQRSGGASLLQRIQLQRQREQQMPPASTIQVPQYQPEAPVENFAGGGRDPEANGNFWSNAWSNVQTSMESGMAGIPPESQHQALLASDNDNHNYTMSGYFMTFVRDVYGAFLGLPVYGRGIVIAFLLIVALRLL